MSTDLLVYLERERMLAQPAWQSAIDRAGFSLRFQGSFDVYHSAGMLPCQYDGELTGFEYYPHAETDRGVGLGMPDADFAILFAVGSSPNEMPAAICAASALCAATGGVLVDPQSGQRVRAERAIVWARDMLAVLAELDSFGRAEGEPRSASERLQAPAEAPPRGLRFFRVRRARDAD